MSDMTTTAPQMPTAVDLLADRFVAEHADRISPIEFYVADKYNARSFDSLSEQHKLATLTVVTHAVQHCQFKTTFQHRRAALQALRMATGRLTASERPEPTHEFRAVYANLIGKLASNVAATYVPDPE